MESAESVEVSPTLVQQPDIPSLTLELSEPVEGPRVQTKSKELIETPLVQTKPSSAVIAPPEPGKDATISAELSSETIPNPLPVKRTIPKAPPKKRPLKIGKLELVEPDEITQVRPPSNRITIAWDAASVRRNYPFEAPPPRKSDNISFYPTILGGRNEKSVTEEVAAVRKEGEALTEGIFSNYHGTPSAFSSNARRVAMLGIGVVGLTSLLLFGNDSFTRYFQSWSSADSVATKALPAKKTSGQSPRIVPSPVQNQPAAPAVEKPLTEPAAEKQPTDTDAQKPLKNSEKPVAETEVAKDRRSTAADTKLRNTSDKTVLVKPSLPAAAPKSEEKSRPKVESAKKVTVKKPPREETAGTFNYSRPRVVKDPKP